MKPVLIARMFGGLGNQLFIYANARALSQRIGADLVLDTWSGFQRDPYQRQFSLEHFNIQYENANAWQSFHFPGGRVVRKLLWQFNYWANGFNYILEKDFEKCDITVKNYNIKRPSWIEGLWQSPYYFEDFERLIRHEFKIKTPVSKQSILVATQIAESEAVCLHIRRLRNVIVGEENAKIKTLDLEYYRKAAESIAKAIPNAHFFCFSDAPEWMENNLKLDYPATYVTHNKGDELGHEDLWLMQTCKHFIISNSTFAWWAAWLGEYKYKKVISPDVRFWDNKDILPQGWQILKA